MTPFDIDVPGLQSRVHGLGRVVWDVDQRQCRWLTSAIVIFMLGCLYSSSSAFFLNIYIRIYIYKTSLPFLSVHVIGKKRENRYRRDKNSLNLTKRLQPEQTAGFRHCLRCCLPMNLCYYVSEAGVWQWHFIFFAVRSWLLHFCPHSISSTSFKFSILQNPKLIISFCLSLIHITLQKNARVRY